MAREIKPPVTERRMYWCRSGNHRCYRFDLAIVDETGHYGICRACVRQETGGHGLRRYWEGEEDANQ